MNSKTVIVLWFLGACVCQEAQAQLVPATWELTASGATYLSSTTQLSLANSYTYDNGAYFSSDETTLNPLSSDPTIEASGTGGYGGAASATLTYYIEVNGPTNTYVPVDFSASGSLALSGLSASGQSTYSIQYYGNYGGEITQSAVNTSGSYSTNVVLMLPAGIANIASITMTATVDSSSSSIVYRPGTVIAAVDPTFTIDPSFTSTNSQYSIGYSPNLTAVPEPSTIGLTALGASAIVCAVASGFRNRRRKS
jgi:hypothetical protein